MVDLDLQLAAVVPGRAEHRLQLGHEAVVGAADQAASLALGPAQIENQNIRARLPPTDGAVFSPGRPTKTSLASSMKSASTAL